MDIVGFRDHSVYKGHQVFLYKRAQIFVADLWGAFKGKGYGEFNDIGEITIFADYIVPAVLQQLGVLKYSAALAGTIEANGEIGSGSEEEVELRTCSVCAVEKMRELIQKKSGKQVCLFFPFAQYFLLTQDNFLLLTQLLVYHLLQFSSSFVVFDGGCKLQ